MNVTSVTTFIFCLPIILDCVTCVSTSVEKIDSLHCLCLGIKSASVTCTSVTSVKALMFYVSSTFKLVLQLLHVQALQPLFSISFHQISLCYKCYKRVRLRFLMFSNHIGQCYKRYSPHFLFLFNTSASVTSVTRATFLIFYIFVSNRTVVHV